MKIHIEKPIFFGTEVTNEDGQVVGHVVITDSSELVLDLSHLETPKEPKT